MTSASTQLLGLTLPDGWAVTSVIPRAANGSGGMFSQSYIVEKGAQKAFLKALDFSLAFQPGEDTLTMLAQFISAFENERDVLDHCAGRRFSKVALAIGHGEIQIPNMGPMEGRVFYLIFEMAAGDVRRQMNAMLAEDVLWCVRAINAVALGLWQVHRDRIAHQDIKPSNILEYARSDFKVADFGRSSRISKPIYYDSFVFPGDRTYAPPELLYGHINPDFVPRRIGTDLYMLGNLTAFVFTGSNVTAKLLSAIAPQHHWTQWGQSYADVLPYLEEGFARTMEDISADLPQEVKDEARALIAELCQPDLLKRGHPKGIGRGDQYSLERYVSQLDQLVRRVEMRLRAAGRVA
jgi:serine/threonine protein kinase